MRVHPVNGAVDNSLPLRDKAPADSLALGSYWKQLFLVFLLAQVAHAPALANGYVLDDGALLVNNPHLRSFDGLGTLLSHELFAASGEYRNVPYYRPLSGALYWLSYQMLGAHSTLQHGFNLVLHGVLSALLLAIVLTVSGGRRPKAALFGVSLFAVHPTTAEVVAYIGGRQDMLGWIFILTTLLWLLRNKPSINWHWGLAVGLGTVSSALSREYFLCAPALLLLAVWTKTVQSVYRRAASMLAGGLIAIAAVFALRASLGIQSFQLELPGTGAVAETLSGIALRLLELVLAPLDISVEVSPTILRAPWSALLVAFLGLTTLGSLLVVWRRSTLFAFALFAWTSFWTATVLHAPVVLKYGFFSDRYSYGVILGLGALVGAGLQLAPRVPTRYSTAALATGILVWLSLLPLAWTRDSEWKSELSLQAAMLKSRPNDPQSRFAEGMRLFAANHLEEAYPHCLAYQEARPASHRAGLCIGTVLLQRREPIKAAAALEPHAFSRPGSLRARVTLFRAWFAANDLDGVRRGLGYYRSYASGSPDLVAAQQELEARVNR